MATEDDDRSTFAPALDATLAATLGSDTNTPGTFGPYRVDGQLGAGGMGIVFSARDAAGQVVAIKRLHRELADAKARERFVREARILETLEHPALVRHIDHGRTSEGDPYLVMEWLEGEDLSQRLRRGPLSVEDAVRLGLRLASGLAAAHAAGVLHRDIKPSNIFLPGGALEAAKVIDFGVARWRLATRALTRTGGIVGTPGYMSPEQARGEVEVDERTDIYSLGCVLYECLAGRPAFSGRHAIAMLAKILLEDPEPLAQLRPELSPLLCAVIADMMQRDRSARLTAMGDVSAALQRVAADARGQDERASPPRSGPSVSRREHSLLTIIFLNAPSDSTDAITDEAQHYGGRAVGLVRDAHLVVFEIGDSPVDVCARAARCALALRAHGMRAQALVSGRAELSGRSVVGQLVELGAELLGDTPAGTIAIDDATRDLLDERFEFAANEAGGVLLVGFDDARTAQRTVLGRASPFVGRLRELGQLRGIVEAAIDEETACAIVITAEPGVGKSRLRHELLTALAREHDLCVLLGRGDAVSARVAFGLVSRALRSHAAIVAGEPAERQRAKIRGVLPLNLDADPERVALFLTELAGVSAREPLHPALETARRDPSRMRESIRLAWTQWLRAELSSRTMILVLEDLHWGDEATIGLLDHTLHVLADQPLVILALARPELDERFGEFWLDHRPTRLPLRPLSPRASAKLLAELSGETWPEELDQRIVSLAGGNAFYLEELVRIIAASRGDRDSFELPDTILATARSRLARLDDQTRRLLRAAAVFGERFWSGALQALLRDRSPQQIQAGVEAAIAHEHVIARPTSSVAGNREFAFAHALIRDAAYSALTPEDRRLAHELAAAWLEVNGACEASVLADHHHQAGNHAGAARWYERAARFSLESNDFGGALELAARGLELVEVPELRGLLLAIRAQSMVHLGHYEDAVELSHASLELLGPEDEHYWEMQRQLAEALGRLARYDDVEDLLVRLLETQPSEADVGPWVRACCRATLHLIKGQGFALVTPYAERLRAVIDPERADKATRLDLLLLEHELADLRGDLGTCYRLLDTIDELKRALGWTDHGDGHVLAQLGLNERAEESMHNWLEFATRHGMQHSGFVAAGMLGGLALRRDAWDEAAALLERAHGFSVSDPRMLGPVTGFQAFVARHRGQLDEALTLARRSEALLRPVRPLHSFGLAVLSSIHLSRGEIEDALRHARAGVAILDELGGISEFEVAPQVALLESLMAAGETDEARTRAQAFRRRLQQRCAWIDDPEIERAFLTRVPDNARLVQRCSELLEGTGGVSDPPG